MTESLFQAYRHERGLPGLVGAVFDLHNIDVRVCGLRDVDSGDPLQADDPFPLASVTKTFTADLVLRAASAGFIDLDAPISAQLPDFALADPDAGAHMTPRDALCHFSGLPPHTWAWVYGDLSRDAFLRERLPHLPAAGPFRAQHRYSNLLYAVLGSLLETRCGASWESLLSSQLLAPLRLDHTRPLDEHWIHAGVCPHTRDGLQARRIAPFVARAGHLIAPASELAGSIPDLARWGQAQLALAADDPRWHPHNRVSEHIGYGLGWRIDLRDGPRRVWHSGQCSGFSSLLVLYPNQGLGAALATNCSNAIPELQALEQGLAPSTLPARTARSSAPIPCPPSPAPEPGLYQNPGYGSLHIEARDSQLWARFQNAPATPLQALGHSWHITLPHYDVSFPLRVIDNTLHIPFEPECGDIVFQ